MKKTEINKQISDKSNYTSHQSKKLSSKKTAGCSQWPTQPSAGKSHCPGHKSQKKLRPSFLHPPGKRNRSSNTAHRPPDARCGSQGPPFGAPAASTRAKAPGPPSSYSAYTTCNKLKKISNFQNTKPRENTTNLPKKLDLWNTKSYHRHPTAKRNDKEVKKKKRKDISPLHHFNRTVPATT